MQRGRQCLVALLLGALTSAGCAAMMADAPRKTSLEWLGWHRYDAATLLISVQGERAELSVTDERGTTYTASARVTLDETASGAFTHEGFCVTFSGPAAESGNRAAFDHIMVSRHVHRLTPELPVGHVTLVECDSPSGSLTVDLFPDAAGRSLIGYLP